jgi:hypothetical protein
VRLLSDVAAWQDPLRSYERCRRVGLIVGLSSPVASVPPSWALLGRLLGNLQEPHGQPHATRGASSAVTQSAYRPAVQGPRGNGGSGSPSRLIRPGSREHPGGTPHLAERCFRISKIPHLAVAVPEKAAPLKAVCSPSLRARASNEQTQSLYVSERRGRVFFLGPGP